MLTRIVGASSINRSSAWVCLGLVVFSTQPVSALDLDDIGFVYATADRSDMDCVRTDALIAVDTLPRESSVSGCSVEARSVDQTTIRWDYVFTDTGTTPTTKLYYGPFQTGNPDVCAPLSQPMTEAAAYAACQNGRSSYLAEIRARMKIDHFVCMRPAAHATFQLLQNASDPSNGSMLCKNLGTLSSKPSLNRNWACASPVRDRLLSDASGSAVATRIDLQQDASCLNHDTNTGQAMASACDAATPRWLLDPTNGLDAYRLRSGANSGLCLEVASAAPFTVTTATCRARNDASIGRQTWTFPPADGAMRLIRNSGTDACLVRSGSAVTAVACQLVGSPVAHQWSLNTAPYSQERWRSIHEYAITTRRPWKYLYLDSSPDYTLIESGVFVALAEPAADTLPVYRDFVGRLTTCEDDSAECGEIVFYTPRPPSDPSDSTRVPVYEYLAPSSVVTNYRYSTRAALDPVLDAGWVRQPGIAFFAYPNIAATEERVNEVVRAVSNLMSELAVPSMPTFVSAGSRAGGASFERVANELRVYSSNFANGVERPDREEMLHVFGHVIIDAMLGPLGDDDACITTPAAGVASAFHRPRDRLNQDWQPESCVFREGWAEYFTSQMLHEQASLGSFDSGGTDRMVHHPGRRTLIAQFVLEGFVALVSVGIIVVNEVFIGHSRLEQGAERLSRRERFVAPLAVIAALPKRSETSLQEYAAANSTTQQAATAALANAQGASSETTVMSSTGIDFKQLLVSDPNSMCQVIDTNDEWVLRDCRTTQRVLCLDTSTREPEATAVYKLTEAVYPLYDAVEACILEFGTRYEPVTATTTGTRKRIRYDYRVMNATGALVPWATGEAYDSKRLRRMPVGTGLDTIPAAVTSLATETANPNYNYLLVHTLNVGAGSCHIVQCRGSAAVFADCGSMGSNQPVLNAASTLAYAQEMGVFTGDPHPTVVVSHPHGDHYSYLRRVFTNRTPDKVLTGGSPGSYRQAFQSWATSLRNQNIPVNGSTTVIQAWPAATTRVATFPTCGGAVLDVLTVNTGGVGVDYMSGNRNSAVLLLKLPGKFIAILPGDAIETTENTARTLRPFNQANFPLMRFLVASHHGADGLLGTFSNTQAWITYVQPTHVAYSAGIKHRHPRCNVFNRYDAMASLGQLPVTGAHDVECGLDVAGWSTLSTRRRQYSTRMSGTMIAGVAIPKPNTNGTYRAFFVTH